jgi:titin
VRNLRATADTNGGVQLDWDAPISSNTQVDKYMIDFYDLDQIGGTASGGWGIYVPGNTTTFTFDSSMFTGSNPVTTGVGPVRFEVYAADANWFYGPRTSVDATVLDPNATTTTLAPQVAVSSAPLELSATKGTNAVSLTWNVPTTAGGAPITDYVVSYSQSSTGPFTTFDDGTSTSTAATVTGLTNGSAYYFKVAAVNSGGTGAVASLTGSVTPAQPCSSACAVGDIGPGGGIIFITPSTSGNSSGEYFEAAPNNWNGGSDANIAWCNSSSTSITGSTGTSIGSGKSNTAAVASTCTSGASDTAIAYTGGGESDWFLPSIDELLQMYNQRTAIGGFKATNRGTTTISTATYWSSTQNSATQARNWSFADNGNDNWSKSLGFNVRPIRSFSAPSQPLSASASAGDAEAVLTWSAPSTSNGSSITDYVIKYATTSGGPYTTFNDGVSTSRTTTVTGLSNGVPYYFTVSAVNAAGTGTASAVTTAVTPLAPAPVISSITGSNGQIDVSWGAVSHGGDNYQIWWGTDATWATSFTYTGTTNTTYNISGLVNGTTYYVRVAGWNNSLSPQVGTTPWSTNASAVAGVAPLAPTSISAESVFLGANLVINPGAESGTSGWSYTGDWYVGPGWNTARSGTESSATSYTLATRTQTVSLASETTTYLDTSPDIEVSTWFNGRCGTRFFMRAELLDGSANVLATQNFGSESSLMANIDLVWNKRTLRFSGYPSGVRSVRYTDGGKDGCFWAGYYGAAMDDTSVKVRQPSVSGIAQVNLSWAAAGLNGGSAITDYIVEYATSSGGSFSVFNDGVHAGTSASINGLTGGNTYFFRVKAVSSGGTSSASSETYGVYVPA